LSDYQDGKSRCPARRGVLCSNGLFFDLKGQKFDLVKTLSNQSAKTPTDRFHQPYQPYQLFIKTHKIGMMCIDDNLGFSSIGLFGKDLASVIFLYIGYRLYL